MLLYKELNAVVGTVSLGATAVAAAAYDAWPPLIAGGALGTLTFLWSIKGAAEDRRYKALAKRLEDSEEDIAANRKDRLQVQEFYSTKITEIEQKHRERTEEMEQRHREKIAELEQTKLQIMLDLQEAQAIARRQIASDTSTARAMVAVEAAKSTLASEAKVSDHAVKS